MQVFRLVNAGYADRLIIFDALPKRLLNGIRTRELAGLPRRWGSHFVSIGSTRKVMKTHTTMHPDRSYTYTYTPVGDEPCFYVLDYQDINADKEAWRAISEYVRTNVGPEVRLREKLEDMAVVMASGPTQPLELEPEDIPVIPLPEEKEFKQSPDDLISEHNPIVVNEPPVVPKRRGRPKKAVMEA